MMHVHKPGQVERMSHAIILITISIFHFAPVVDLEREEKRLRTVTTTRHFYRACMHTILYREGEDTEDMFQHLPILHTYFF